MAGSSGPPQINLIAETSLSKSDYDGILLVSSPEQKIPDEVISTTISRALEIDPSANREISVQPLPDLPAKRLIYVPTGPLDPDYDDVRSLGEAAVRGVKRLIKAGVTRPLVVLPVHPRFEKAQLVTLLGVLEALYVPLQFRELAPEKSKKPSTIGVLTEDPAKTNALIREAQLLEFGRSVARDIGAADPERMAPKRIEQYITSLFKDTPVKVTVINDEKELVREYPLFAAVNRAASGVERHQGRVVFLEYAPDPKNVEKTLFLVGKGVTYDTGGADIKAGGVMAGMSRDKCGAAAVAGFLAVVSRLQPQNVRVVGGLSLVRNSVGSNCYVSDELIVSRAGTRVRIGNTDAEGRMVMTDVLARMKELALEAVNPHLFTIATLTGHAYLAVGRAYTIGMDNGPARRESSAQNLQKAGEQIGDPLEISTLRREDFAFNEGKCEGDEVLQCNNAPSSRTPRGHQIAQSFMVVASGLKQHGSGSAKPLKYTHLDIAGSAGSLPDPATGSPILALANSYLSI